MDFSKFSQENRKEQIQSLEFFQCLTEVVNYLQINYGDNKNIAILGLLQVLVCYRDFQWSQIRDYGQLLSDSIFWQSRKFYRKNMRKFVDGELDGSEFVSRVLYRILSEREDAQNLEEDFYRQRTIDLDPKSFQFSKIILNLVLPLEGFDEDPNKSFFNEKELQDGIKIALKEMDKYFF